MNTPRECEVCLNPARPASLYCSEECRRVLEEPAVCLPHGVGDDDLRHVGLSRRVFDPDTDY